MASAVRRRQLRIALRLMVNELFKVRGKPENIDLRNFDEFFKPRERDALLRMVSELVIQRSFGHWDVVAITAETFQTRAIACEVFVQFVRRSDSGNNDCPTCYYFAFGPRLGVFTR